MDLETEVDSEAIALSKGCQHYADLSEMAWDIQKCVTHFCDFCDGFTHNLDRYYHQRFSIFSKYDEGVWMTEDAWFGVTPEPVAR